MALTTADSEGACERSSALWLTCKSLSCSTSSCLPVCAPERRSRYMTAYAIKTVSSDKVPATAPTKTRCDLAGSGSSSAAERVPVSDTGVLMTGDGVVVAVGRCTGARVEAEDVADTVVSSPFCFAAASAAAATSAVRLARACADWSSAAITSTCMLTAKMRRRASVIETIFIVLGSTPRLAAMSSSMPALTSSAI